MNSLHIIYKSQIIVIIILCYITTNCHAQTPSFLISSTSIYPTLILDDQPQIAAATAFYEDLDTLKYIAIAALIVLICCCVALILFVRTQVRKTEQGTEIQKYIRKRRESQEVSQISKNNPLKFVPSSSVQNGLANHVNNNNAFQFDHANIGNLPPMINTLQKSVSINHQNDGPSLPVMVNNISHPQLSHMSSYDIVSPSNATPGGDLFALDDDQEVAKELYLVKIAEQNEMKQKFEVMHKESLYENQAEEDEDFGQILNDAMQFQQNQQDKIFNDMASEQYKNEQNVQQQQQQQEIQRKQQERKSSYSYRYSQHRSNKSQSEQF